MDLFYFKKLQRKKTANHQTQDVGFHVKTLGFQGDIMVNPFPKPARQNIPLVDLSHLRVVRRGIAGIVVNK